MILMINKNVKKRAQNNLREFYQGNFKRTSLPGEKSVNLPAFRNESRRMSELYAVKSPKESMQTLKANIRDSERNITAINSGRRLSHVLVSEDAYPNKELQLPVLNKPNFRERL